MCQYMDVCAGEHLPRQLPITNYLYGYGNGRLGILIRLRALTIREAHCCVSA
jgi:hypothetical protein